METQELVKETTPSKLLELAIQSNLDIDKLEKLLAMQERWEAKEAKKTFLVSLSKFQGEIPEIVKTKMVGYITKDGNKVAYNYAPLGEISKQIKESLVKFGLSYRWQITEAEKSLTVTCIVSHETGHSEQTTMSAAPDDSGKKNQIQSRASTITYLQRYTLIGALGIATADEDKDGHKPPKTKAEIKAEISDEVKKRIKSIKNVEALLEYAGTIDHLHKNIEFRKLVAKRKEELENVKQ